MWKVSASHIYYDMSQQSTTPNTPKQMYDAALQASPTVAVIQTTGVCTRGMAMAKKNAINTAAARLRAFVVPTKVSAHNAASIAATVGGCYCISIPNTKRRKILR